MHLNPELLHLSLSYFDLAETGVRGTARCNFKQGAYPIKNIVQVDEVQVMWLWRLCCVIRTKNNTEDGLHYVYKCTQNARRNLVKEEL